MFFVYNHCFLSALYFKQMKRNNCFGSSRPEIYLSQEGKFTLDTVAKGLKIPFGIDWLPDGPYDFYRTWPQRFKHQYNG